MLDTDRSHMNQSNRTQTTECKVTNCGSQSIILKTFKSMNKTWIQKTYGPLINPFEVNTHKLNSYDVSLTSSLPNLPNIDTESIVEITGEKELHLTGVHRFTRPVFCYSIFRGSQFMLNNKFSNFINYSSSNNNYQNLYLSYKKSTITKYLKQLQSRLTFPSSLSATSIPSLVIHHPDADVQISVDRYEGYYNQLLFESYKRLHPSIRLLFDAVDIIHEHLYPLNQHLSTLTRVMVVHFLHSIGIPVLQDVLPCSSPNHIIHKHCSMCTVLPVQWSECTDCIQSKVPKELTLTRLLIDYLYFYLTYDYSNRICTSVLFFADKGPCSKENVFSVFPPFAPWVLLSTSTTIEEFQEMLHTYKAVYTKLCAHPTEFRFDQLPSDIVLPEVDEYTTVVMYDLPEGFSVTQLIKELKRVALSCELLLLLPVTVSQNKAGGGAVFLKFASVRDSSFFMWIERTTATKRYVPTDQMFREMPNGSLYMRSDDTLFIE